MAIPLTRQDLRAVGSYDLAVTAAPLDLDQSAASLADKAYVAIRDQLIMLDIRPNEPIDDDELARALGVGRTPVREALKRLEGDRLDRNSTRLNSSHANILHAVFCLKKINLINLVVSLLF